jgi:5-methylcytosine-specific restriction endonuclease McrA
MCGKHYASLCRPALTEEQRALSNARARKWYLDNMAVAKQRATDYRENNPERVKQVKKIAYANRTPEQVAKDLRTRAEWKRNNPELVLKERRGYYDKNKGVITEKQAEYRRKHPDRVKASKAKYVAENPEARKASTQGYVKRNPGKRADSVAACCRRRKQAPGDLTAEGIREIRAAHKEVCAYCFESGAKDVEHIIPLARGGHHTASNVVISCGPCNSKKWCHTLYKFLSKMPAWSMPAANKTK